MLIKAPTTATTASLTVALTGRKIQLVRRVFRWTRQLSFAEHFSTRPSCPRTRCPTAEGPAELIVHAQLPKEQRHSIFDAFGTAEYLRTAEDLDAQLAEERAAWGDA